VIAAEPAPRSVVFDDGSKVALSVETCLETLENDGHALMMLLRTGAAAFDVRPNGPRRWSIECGLATVEVVGTRFSIERAPSLVRVNVEHGIVLVRSDRLPDRVQRLTDGQSVEIGDGPLIPPPPPAASSPQPTGADAATYGTSSVGKRSPDPPAADWRALAQSGAYAQAYVALGSAGLRSVLQSGAVTDLLTVADIARSSGHPAEAVAPLVRVVEEHPDDARAPLAAFTLGRLELDTLGDPARAAESFRRAIALGIPKTLLEDAYARLVEARARAGQRDAAREAAADYGRRFPGGRRAGAVARWVAGP
jgi:transmembrane sensor